MARVTLGGGETVATVGTLYFRRAVRLDFRVATGEHSPFHTRSLKRPDRPIEFGGDRGIQRVL